MNVRKVLVVAAFAAGLVAALLLTGCEPPQGGAKKSPDAVKVEFYVMSLCPYGVQVENAVKEVVDKLGPDIDFSLEFIGNKDAKGNLTSMHGPDEVAGGIVQLCAAKYAPAKYMDMIQCQNKNTKEVAKNWEKCAQDARLPVAKIRSCKDGPEGKQLLQASFERAQAKSARGSPTIFIAGKPYSGKRATANFFRAICAEHKGAKKPLACQNIPESPKVNVTYLSDKRCTECNLRGVQGMVSSGVDNPVAKNLDYSDPEGKKLYDEAKLTNLPAAVFDATLDADKEATGNPRFIRGVRQVGQYRVLDQGATWNPICAGEGGCAIEGCGHTAACRQEVPNKLEVFVMSQCPYGVRALDAMDEVLKNFDKKIDFKVNFIANGTAEKGFTALHGQPEVDENIRELCAIKLYEKGYKFMDYVLCRNKEIKSADWEKCTGSNGIDTKKMKACFEGEGKKLHEENIKIANALGIGGSPTWLANNLAKNRFSGIDAETIKSNLCRYNKDLKGCENKLTGGGGPGGGPAPKGGGCGQ